MASPSASPFAEATRFRDPSDASRALEPNRAARAHSQSGDDRAGERNGDRTHLAQAFGACSLLASNRRTRAAPAALPRGPGRHPLGRPSDHRSL